MPRVSIITPTRNRHHLLPAIWECVRKQSEADFEWLVHDSSLQPASKFIATTDARVRYMHDPRPLTIGAKRNVLCQAAQGDIIAQFDDDDHYAPHYLEHMLSFMNQSGADFIKLFGFFLYSRPSDTFAYWDLEYDLPIHFVLEPNSALKFGPTPAIGDDEQWGYGFSYVFRRKVWQAVPFPDRNHGEDHEFANAVVKRFKSAGLQDTERLCLHVVHNGNTSIAFPQRRLRRTMLAEMFPGFG
jgi:glycosyltransferase involved in cell wall biosynthesis